MVHANHASVAADEVGLRPAQSRRDARMLRTSLALMVGVAPQVDTYIYRYDRLCYDNISKPQPWSRKVRVSDIVWIY